MALDDMMSTPQEEQHRRRGWLLSFVIHVTLIVIALLPLLTFPDPPPGQEGILVNLGLPDQGQGDENAGPSEPIAEAEPTPEPEPEPEPARPEPSQEKPAPAPEKEVVRTEDPEAVALRKKREEEARQRREDEQRQQREEAEARRKAEEARKKAEAEEQARKAEEARKQAEADKLKNQIGGLFGSGKGKGETGKTGNQGDPGGDPDASKLEGISTGAGKIGGGLSDRGLVAAPKPEDSSQATGTVVVEVCVDAAGNITSAVYTQRGSTTTNAELVRIAVNNAKKWRFSRSDKETQCGTITYNFRLR